MRMEKIERELRAANPVAPRKLAALGLDTAEAALGAALFTESARLGEPEVFGLESRRRPQRARRTWLALGAVTAVAASAVLLFLAGGTEPPTRAYGARLVRFAEATPLLLLEAPGWHVRNTNELANGEGMMEFVTGKPAPHEFRQGWVDLAWQNAKLSEVLKPYLHGPVDRVPGRKLATTLPTLGTKVYIDTRAESAPQYGGPGDHEMVAIWREGGHVLVLNTRVPDLAAFRERLGWLHRVEAQTWLDAMPAKVVKAADRAAAVSGMLQGIPLPPGFDPAKISSQSLTTSRYEVGVAVGGGVACEWFSRWGEARRSGDDVLAKRAERALAGAGQWPIFREMSKEGAYPAAVVEYAKAMPSGRWYGRPLLGDVGQGLGCSLIGFPLRPSKTG